MGRRTSSQTVRSDKYVDIGTHRLRVVLSDIASEYTIVLEAGGGKASESYQEIQDTLAALSGTRVMSYDRSGFGQSELGPEDFNAIDEVEALKTCLEVQGFKDKLILVGLSYGGFLVQLFTSLYPERVSGLVLIDPMNVRFVDRFGFDNLNAVTPYFENPTENYQKAGNRMVDFFPEALEALRGKELPTQIPVVLITAGNPPFSADVWRKCHEEMVMNSAKHELLIAEGNNHDIVDENPELVLKTIVELVSRVEVNRTRDQPCPPPSDSVGERIARVENGLVLMSSNGQPQWGTTSALAERMAYYQAPGIGIAVINEYKIDWVKGYGVRAVGEGQAVTAQTLFHAGSVAKSLSAAATLTLVEQGLLNLDEDVNDRLVSWRVPESEYTRVEKVTLRRLLSHSAGLKDGLTNRGPDDPVPAYVTFGDEVPGVTLQQLLEGMPEDDIAATSVDTIPGTSYRYANADYAILELLVEDRLGQPFEDFMQAAVLDRLGMPLSSYHQPLPQHLRALSASEHTLDGKPIAGGRANFPFHAAGSLWTTPGDLAVFMIDLMKAYQGETGHLLSSQTAQYMLSPQIAIADNPLSSDASGLGVELQHTSQGPRVSYTGGTWGSNCIIWFYPQIGKGAVVMTNSASGSLLRFEILLSIALAYGWPMG